MTEPLLDPKATVVAKMLRLYEIMNDKSPEVVQLLIDALPLAEGALLRHEICYSLGQTESEVAVPTLIKVLADRSEDPVTRHEAAEGLAAVGTGFLIEKLREYENDADIEVAQTVQLALCRLDDAATREPETRDGSAPAIVAVGPALPASKKPSAAHAVELFDMSLPLYQRYAALYALRDIATGYSSVINVSVGELEGRRFDKVEDSIVFLPKETSEAESNDPSADVLAPEHDARVAAGVIAASLPVLASNLALAAGEGVVDASRPATAYTALRKDAILRHEIAFIIGQLGVKGKLAAEALIACVDSDAEHPMVRHEAALALGP